MVLGHAQGQRGGHQRDRLLSHTSGLSYSILDQHPVDEIYRRAGLATMERGGTLADRISRLAVLPLRHHPGTRWSYSMATDVLGRVVEVLDDRPFADCLADRILEPLGMDDTSFLVPDERVGRLSSCYGLSLYTSDAADEGLGLDLGCRRLPNTKKRNTIQ